jgi:hypothetical protein
MTKRVTLPRALLLLFAFGICQAHTSKQPAPPKTKLVILGVGHSSQLVAESYQPAVLRAFIDRVKPDAICIERSPQEFTRNDFYEFTYEQQYLAIPYAKEHRIPLYPIDWLPSAEDTSLAFNLPDLEKPLFVRRASGFLGFMTFTDKADLNRDLFYSETESSRNEQKTFANTPQVEFDFARRLYLYRTFMQAMRILRAANDNRGKTVLVVIGSLHKNDIEQILNSEETLEIVQPSTFGRPDAASVMSAVKREDLLAVAMFNLLGVQSRTENVNWDWLKGVIARLENESLTAEVLLLKTRLQVLTKQISPRAALEIYGRVFAMAEANEQFTWTAVKDRSRVDTYFDPFGNLSIRQRAQLEMARENSKLKQISPVEEARRQLRSQLSTTKAQQLDAYWEEYVSTMP